MKTSFVLIIVSYSSIIHKNELVADLKIKTPPFMTGF